MAQILSLFINTHQVAPFEIYRIDKCEAAVSITVSENSEPSGLEMSSNESQLSKHEEKVSPIASPCVVPLV